MSHQPHPHSQPNSPRASPAIIHSAQNTNNNHNSNNHNNNNSSNTPAADDPFAVLRWAIFSAVTWLAFIMGTFNSAVEYGEVALAYLKPHVARFLLSVEASRGLVSTPLGAVLSASLVAGLVVLGAVELYKKNVGANRVYWRVALVAIVVLSAGFVLLLQLPAVCSFAGFASSSTALRQHALPAPLADAVDGFIIDYPGVSREVLQTHPLSTCALDGLPPGVVVVPILNGALQINDTLGWSNGDFAPGFVVYGRHSEAAYKRAVRGGLERCKLGGLDRRHVQMRSFKWRDAAATSDDLVLPAPETVKFALADHAWLRVESTPVLTHGTAKLLCNTLRAHSQFPAVQMLGHLPNSPQPRASFVSAEKNMTNGKFYYRGGPLMFEPLEVPQQDFCRGEPNNFYYIEEATRMNFRDDKWCLNDISRDEMARDVKHLKCEFTAISLSTVHL